MQLFVQQVKSSIESVVAQLPGPPKYNLFATTEAAEAEYAVNHTNIAAGVIFNFDGGPYSYAIRMNYDAVPQTTGSNSNPSTQSFCYIVILFKVHSHMLLMLIWILLMNVVK